MPRVIGFVSSASSCSRWRTIARNVPVALLLQFCIALTGGLPFVGGEVDPKKLPALSPVTSKAFNRTSSPCHGLCSDLTFCFPFLEFNDFWVYTCIANCSAVDCPVGDKCLATPCDRIYDRMACADHQTQSLPRCYNLNAAQSFQPCGVQQSWCSRENPYCYSLDYRCNGVKNCPGGEDEENCPSTAVTRITFPVTSAHCGGYCNNTTQVCRPAPSKIWFCDADCTNNGPCGVGENCTSVKKDPNCQIGDGCDRIPKCIPKNTSTPKTSTPVMTVTSRAATPTTRTEHTTSVAVATTSRAPITLPDFCHGRCGAYQNCTEIMQKYFCVGSCDNNGPCNATEKCRIVLADDCQSIACDSYAECGALSKPTTVPLTSSNASPRNTISNPATLSSGSSSPASQPTSHPSTTVLTSATSTVTTPTTQHAWATSQKVTTPTMTPRSRTTSPQSTTHTARTTMPVLHGKNEGITRAEIIGITAGGAVILVVVCVIYLCQHLSFTYNQIEGLQVQLIGCPQLCFGGENDYDGVSETLLGSTTNWTSKTAY